MEKPDFNQIAASIYYKNHELDTDTILIIAMDHIWNTHVVPLQEQITKMTTSFIKDQIDGRVYLSADQYQNLAIAAMEQLTNQVKQAESDNKLLREEIESLREQLLEEGERDGN